MSEKVRKKLYYRKAVFGNTDSELKLQTLLDKALESTSVRTRQQTLNSEEQKFIAINNHNKSQGITFCQIIKVNPDSCQPIMHYGKDCPEEYEIDAVSTDQFTEADKGESDFVKSMLYFGVKSNEVIIMPSSALSIANLEKYLKWLLTQNNLLPEKVDFILQKTFTPDVDELIRKHKVKSVVIGSDIGLLPTATDSKKEAEKSETSSSEVLVKDEVAVTTDSIGLKLLKALFSNQTLQDSWVSNLTQQSNLKAKLVITYSRSTDPAGEHLMNVIGTSLRNMDSDDLVLRLNGGGELKGDQLNVSKNISVEISSRGLYVTSNIFNEMSNWLLEIHKKTE